jgi:hypothetical protein
MFTNVAAMAGWIAASALIMFLFRSSIMLDLFLGTKERRPKE